MYGVKQFPRLGSDAQGILEGPPNALNRFVGLLAQPAKLIVRFRLLVPGGMVPAE